MKTKEIIALIEKDGWYRICIYVTLRNNHWKGCRCWL